MTRRLSEGISIMFSTRRLTTPGIKCVLFCLAAAIGGGCSTQEKVVYDPVNTKPIVGDDAMGLRADWPKSVCRYQNGDVAAYSTRYPYQAQQVKSDTGHLVLDTVTF